MKTRHVFMMFALAFALGILTALYLVQRPPRQLAEVAGAPAAGAHPDAKPGADAAPSFPAGAAEDEDPADDSQGEAAWPDAAGSAEQLLYAQGQMMDAAVSRLVPRTPGRANLYVLVFAGDGSENVFRNEAEYVEKLFDERFDAAGHTLVLINNPSTLLRYPIASLSNLQTAVDAMALRMDADQDVLLLFLTTHGSRDHELYVSLDPLPLDQIAPVDLADLFTGTQIRNKVVVISACYSGGFIDALKGRATMVITAARTDRASFGCGTQSAMTYFGRAFFAAGLNDNDSIPAAFAEARKLIDKWETAAGEEHSEPQIASTPQIESRLRAWRDGIHPGAPVPFDEPPARKSASAAASLSAAK